MKNSRYLWLKNPWNLTEAERLATLVKLNTEVHRAYLLKEMFRRFWEYKRPGWAKRFLMPIVGVSDMWPVGRPKSCESDRRRDGTPLDARLEADGTLLNSAHFPHDILLAHPLSDSILLANGTIRTPDRIGLPFHLVHVDGTILGSFGPEASLMSGAEEPGYRYIAVIDERRFLSTAMSGRPYRIELWDGRSLRTVWTRATEWFPEAGPPRRSREIRPRVGGLHRDGSRLWTIVTVPDPAYTPAPPGTRVVVDSQYRDSRWDTVVELIDLTLGEVVASQRFDQHILRLLWDGTGLRLGADDLGVPLWQILGLRFRTPPEL